MGIFKENLLVQFSTASLVIIFAIAFVTSLLLTSRLDRIVDLLQDRSTAMSTGVTIQAADPHSVLSVAYHIEELQTTVSVVLTVGFLVLYFALVGIAWRGWKIITRQRNELELAKVGLAHRVKELRETNMRLQSEIGERKRQKAILEETLEELRNTQQQLTQQQRMEAMGQLASGVAHDFNNALAPILGNADLLLQAPETLDDKEELIDCLQDIRTSAEDAVNVVSRLREFYRKPETGEIVDAVDVNEVIDSSISMTRPRWKNQAQAEGITINIETDFQEVPRAAISASDLREVATNLIINGADAIPYHGSIIFRTRTDGDMVAVEVSDSGIGMTEEIRKRCMDPFFTTKGDRGTGLGLAMVYGIIHRTHGTIDVESEPGKGTMFVIRLPIATVEHAGSGLAARTQSTRLLQILAVDDDPAALRTLTRLLRAIGHSVDSASNGVEALERFQAGNYDLVVTDRAMPDMNGDQLAAAIKEFDSDQQIIMVTGFAGKMGPDERPRGVDVLVSKPVTMATLREALLKLAE